jgi:hypothetical protein
VTDADRRLAALAAALLRERAPALLARLAAPDSTALVALARDLASAPRAERLRALGGALEPPRSTAASRAAVAAAAAERPRVAAVLGALATGLALRGAAPVLVRLCRERLARIR